MASLSITHPELSQFWNSVRNAPTTLEMISKSTKKKFWWICDKGHEWETLPGVVARGSRCPVCSNQKVLSGFNDLGTTNPEVVSLWNTNRNLPTTASSISAGTKRKFWWICDKGHEWETLPGVVAKGSRCPVCSNQKVLTGFNDMATTHPSLAQEWHPTKNLPITPKEVIASGHTKYWWKCSKGHAWLTNGKNRLKGQGCGVCTNRQVLAGFNDMATTHPSLAQEFHIAKNLPFTPGTLSAGSPKKIWWKCAKGHEWQTSPNSRSSGRSCPVCSNQKVLTGFNDMATTHPSLAQEWHPTKNLPLTPKEVIAGTPLRLWWKCAKGHEWPATGNKRYMDRGCPSCASFGFDSSKPGLLYVIENKSVLSKKVGIMNIDSSRLKSFAELGWTVVFQRTEFHGAVIRDVETQVLRWIRKELQLPQHLSKEDMGKHRGETETFSIDGVENQILIEKIESLFAAALARAKHSG
jgi:hypothetical protein